MAALLLFVLVVGVRAGDDDEDQYGYTSSFTTLQNTQAPTVSNKDEEICDTYIWITLAAITATFFQFILLGFTVYYISLNTSPEVVREGKKRTSGILMKIREAKSPLSQCSSSSSKDILTTKDSQPQHIQPPIQVADTNKSHAQPRPTSGLQKRTSREGNSPMPPAPSIGLPPLPSTADRHSKQSFGDSDEEHEYDYIKLPIIQMPPHQQLNKLETGATDVTHFSDVSDEPENIYDSFVPLAKGN